MSRLIIGALLVSASSLTIAGALFASGPACREIVDNTDCTLNRLDYDIPGVAFGVVGMLLALILLCYSVTWGLDRFDEWRGRLRAT
jgi:hypothetical protein